MAKQLPNYPIPVFIIPCVAVHTSLQGHGLGKAALINALESFYHASKNGISGIGVVIDPVDEKTDAIYRNFGFDTLLGVYGGLSTYNYANASPMMYVDPTGEIAFIPILVGIAAGVVFDYALETYKESRECSCEGSMASTAGNAALGASFGFFGPFDKKPRTGVAGGGRSGDRTSIFSQINHTSARNGLYSNRTRHLLTKAGRSVPYAGTAVAAYQIYNAATCE